MMPRKLRVFDPRCLHFDLCSIAFLVFLVPSYSIQKWPISWSLFRSQLVSHSHHYLPERPCAPWRLDGWSAHHCRSYCYGSRQYPFLLYLSNDFDNRCFKAIYSSFVISLVKQWSLLFIFRCFFARTIAFPNCFPNSSLVTN